MPIYVYKCDDCEVVEEDFYHIQDDALTDCPHCGSDTYHRIPALLGNYGKDYRKPIEMHSIGVAHPDEIDAFQRRNPDTKISRDVNDPLYGVPIAQNRPEKLRILKAEGWEEKGRGRH